MTDSDGTEMLAVAGTARLISDLHLRIERPDLTHRFAVFLADSAACNVDAIFILGDLFEYWIGDDDLADPFNADISGLLRGTADMGPRLYFIAGNRDFLLGERFAAAARMTLLYESTKVSLGGTATLLLHGDTLCTDDRPYQDFRRMVRDPAWQAEFLERPLPVRRDEVAALRLRSQEAIREKNAGIMDVNAEAVREALTVSGCARMIHGHTHRPGDHDVKLGDREAKRWVLSDWDTRRGDAIEIDADGVRRLHLDT